MYRNTENFAPVTKCILSLSYKKRNLLSEFSVIPDLLLYGKHRGCYENHTNKKTLEIIAKINKEKECLFCWKTKAKAGGSGREQLTKCISEATANCLLQHTLQTNDDYIKTELAGLSNSAVVAKEFWHHRKCYIIISRPTK